MRRSLCLLAEAVAQASGSGRATRAKKAVIEVTDSAANRVKELLESRHKVRPIMQLATRLHSTKSMASALRVLCLRRPLRLRPISCLFLLRLHKILFSAPS